MLGLISSPSQPLSPATPTPSTSASGGGGFGRMKGHAEGDLRKRLDRRKILVVNATDRDKVTEYFEVQCTCNSIKYFNFFLLDAYVTRSRKRGPFPQKSDCELDLSADSAKSVVHPCENRLTLARSVPKLQSFEYHTCAYLGFEISAFVSVL